MAKAKKTDNQTEEKAATNQRADSSESADTKSAAETVVKNQSSSKAEQAEESTSEKPAPSQAEQAEQAAEQAVSTLDEVALPAASGKAGVLGGPKDRGFKPDDKLALPVGRHFTFERIRSLNPKSFYCAMRWDYHLQGKSPEESKRWWANKKILVTNPANGNQVVVRAVDFGPHENTGLTISLSPGALDALGLEIGGDVNVEFADQKAPLGVVNE
jgi:hypothetical protein